MNITSKRNPVRVFAATIAALSFLLGGASLAEVVPPKIIGLLVLLVGATQVGVGEYVRGQVTPWADVVAKRTDEGVVVAGPSAEAPTGVEVEEPVETPPPPAKARKKS